MIATYGLPVLVSIVLSLAGILLMLKFFPRLGLMDRPHEYGLTRNPIPYSGGIIFFLVFLIGVLFFVKITPAIFGLVASGSLIMLVSFIDDRVRLSPWLRLAVQILAGIIIVFSGVQIQLINMPFGGPIFLDTITLAIFDHQIWLFSAVFIIGWLVVMMNVSNWLDGIPGLTSGVSAIAQLSIFILSIRQFHVVDQSAVITLSSMLAVSCAVFLLFDFYPPKLLMGDSGSMFLGFMLGALSIIAGGKFATALLIMSFPVLDAVVVVIRRILKRRSPLRGDYSHLHHRLLQTGLSHRATLFLNYLTCALCAAIALLLDTSIAKFWAFVGVFTLMIIVSGVLVYLEVDSGPTERG